MKSTMRVLALSAALFTILVVRKNRQKSLLPLTRSNKSLKRIFLKEGVKVKSVASTPLPDIYEVVIGDPPQDIVYVDGKVTHIFLGDLQRYQNQGQPERRKHPGNE